MLSDAERQKYEDLRGIVARLRAPDGCPWDREQTHVSLRPHVIEEAYEVLAALDAGDTTALPDELGDLLFQVLLHAQLAEEAGEFTMADVLGGLADKLVRRHPHVFGDVHLDTADQVVAQWEKLKQQERGEEQSALSSVPGAMPALAYAQTLLRRAAAAGFAWPERKDVLDKLNEELDELARAQSKEEATAEFGDILINLANYARYLDIDAEEALRLAGHKFRRRFEAVERRARSTSLDLATLSREELMALWTQAKADEA
ncbi:MAG: nucleoside triphosphate pyrophosphohydrolase [Dehalococcoidia bacterium]|nr:nucleoside triphosphate pyrophosphohydrolase [Dehalococcoidia bacterium]